MPNVVIHSILKTKYLISILGPTGIGKTALSIKIAQHYASEIISADSRQFFKEMQIGTAAPSSEELAAAQHHFIHHKSIEDTYNVGAFEKDAIERLDQLYTKHDVVIMVGGSGLYIDAVCKGLDYFPDINDDIRQQLNARLKVEGLLSLQEQLKELDPITFQSIAIDNPHRVIRALEVCLGSGQPYSSFLNQIKSDRSFKTVSIGLTADRSVIYDRINKRVDLMIENGLVEEVTALKEKQDLNALQTVGYSEIFKYLNGEWSLDFAISEIKKNSRRYAKRQLTWFKRSEDTQWFDYSAQTSDIIDYIDKKLRS